MVVEVTVAVFDKTVPSAVLALTVPVTVMVALPPAAIVPRLQGKAAQRTLRGTDCDCRQLLLGSVSLTVTAWASEGRHC